MSEVNARNERTKRRYFHFLLEAEGRSEKTVDHARRAIAQFDRFSDGRDYKQFKFSHAVAFRRHLLERHGRRAVQLSSRSAVHSTLAQVQKFFRWLAGQPGHKKAISYADIEYFSLSGRDRRIAFHRREKASPTLEQVQHVIRSMPATTDLELRDRAVLACILLTGVRIGALVTLKLKHVRPDRLGIDQDAREVATKRAKTFPSFFFPVGDDIRTIFLGYVDYLRNELQWGNEEPLFPATDQRSLGKHVLEVCGLRRAHWATADPVREIFKRAFAAAGVPYHSPHTIRRTLVLLGQQLCTSPEELKAWSQNLGHEEVLTSFTSYGAVPMSRQAQLMSDLASPHQNGTELDELRRLIASPSMRKLLKLSGR